MNVDKQALRGLSVESPFYLAECCNCGEIMPSSKLRESRNYPDDDGECHCPHCNADDCDIADSGAVGSEGVTAWNYQQKRIEALLDELEAAERRSAELTEALRQSVIGYKSCLRMGYDRILDLGGDCDSPEVMIAGNPDIQQAEKLLAAAAAKGE